MNISARLKVKRKRKEKNIAESEKIVGEADSRIKRDLNICRCFKVLE